MCVSLGNTISLIIIIIIISSSSSGMLYMMNCLLRIKYNYTVRLFFFVKFIYSDFHISSCGAGDMNVYRGIKTEIVTNLLLFSEFLEIL